MKDWLDILKEFGVQVAPWMIAVVLILYILRERLNRGLNALLDWLGTIFRGEWSYRRFESVFRPSIRAMHLYMRVVGIRSEKGREPTIPEAYVPLRLAPYFVEDSENTIRTNEKYTGARTPASHSLLNEALSELWSIDDLIQRHTALVVLGDPGAGKSTLLKYLIIPYNGPIDPNIWPYRKSQRTALAAIGQKCVQILSRVYEGKTYGNNEQQKEEFLVCIERITQFDLHIQIPLFILLFKNTEKVDALHGERIGKSFFPKSQYSFSEVKYAINEDAWYSLIALSGMKANNNIWKRVGGFMSGFGLIAGCALLWAGVITLLWHILPAQLLIAGIVIQAIAGILSTWLILDDFFKATPLPKFIDDNDFISTITGLLVILFINFHLVSLGDDSGKEIKRFLAIRKMSFWYPITILIACIVNGVLGGFAVQSWFHLALPLSMLVVGFGCLLCSMLYAWTIAFLKSSEILTWLEQHPNGQAVLDEFRP